MVKNLMRAGAAAAAAVAFGAAQASAEICLVVVCLGGGGEGGGGGETPHAPEIDVTSGFAALAVLACVALVLRERFIRARARS